MNENPEDLTEITLDPIFENQVKKLHKLTIYGRWIVVLCLWLTVGSISFWGFRYPLSLLTEDFTWAALKYGIVYHRLPALGLGLCVGMTIAVIVWQLRNIMFGLPSEEQKQLQKQVYQIRRQGKTHPLWKLVIGE
jgi:hypothetical protein